MEFKEMEYRRPEPEALKAELRAVTAALREAESYEAAKEAFLRMDKMEQDIETEMSLAGIRHSIDTRDAFYDGERTFWNNVGPELNEYFQEFEKAMLESGYRPEFEEEFGKVYFENAKMSFESFSPAIIPELQEEAALATEYEKLLASAQIPFEGEICTLSRLSPAKSCADDARRLAAWKAEGEWYKENQARLDELYDKLVKVRDKMGRKMGFDGYLPLGYRRMLRISYTKEDVESFREAVRKYIVPLASEVYKKQADRLEKEYPMSFADNALEFRSGNPRPQGDAGEIVAAAGRFYDWLSPETSEFFRTMRENGLMDLLSTDGKESGGYCTGLPSYKVPFIFANFNGTKGDVEVLTHEGGHAFAYYLNRDRVPMSTIWPGMEACEVHSMSMEFLAWAFAEEFFGKDAAKFRYSHLASALTFIPYGTMVDHFQHIVYEKPEMTAGERHKVWKELMGIYTPWHRLDGDIPFYSEGEGWQRQHHIYSNPLYYIDYCLAQTVALEIWALDQKDHAEAWKSYMAYTSQGGSRQFTQLIEKAGLKSPFDGACLREVAEQAESFLSQSVPD